MASIGENIHKYRKLRGLTLEQVADKIGVKKQTIQKYEKGVITNIPIERIDQLSSVLEVSPIELTEWTVSVDTNTKLRSAQSLVIKTHPIPKKNAVQVNFHNGLQRKRKVAACAKRSKSRRSVKERV